MIVCITQHKNGKTLTFREIPHGPNIIYYCMGIALFSHLTKIWILGSWIWVYFTEKWTNFTMLLKELKNYLGADCDCQKYEL